MYLLCSKVKLVYTNMIIVIVAKSQIDIDILFFFTK